jgi:Family of unknown function (DUF6636)
VITVRLSAAVAAAAATACAVGAQAMAARPAEFFRTPSKNIRCGYFAAQLRCDIASGLRPLPPKPASCDFDWGQTYFLTGRGRTVLGCVSDSVFSPTARVLGYGTPWHKGGIVCRSRATGLRCTNASGHGFFMSRARSYRF